VEDRPRRGVQVMPAVDARPGLALLLSSVASKHALRLALRAVGVLSVFGVAVAPKPLYTGSIIGELAHKLHDGVLRFRYLPQRGCFSFPVPYTFSTTMLLYSQGIITFREGRLTSTTISSYSEK
jgi:hypothetical protein